MEDLSVRVMGTFAEPSYTKHRVGVLSSDEAHELRLRVCKLEERLTAVDGLPSHEPNPVLDPTEHPMDQMNPDEIELQQRVLPDAGHTP